MRPDQSVEKVYIMRKHYLCMASSMNMWALIGLAAAITVLFWYWYKPAVFKVHPEKRYQENYSKHADPPQYKRYK